MAHLHNAKLIRLTKHQINFVDGNILQAINACEMQIQSGKGAPYRLDNELNSHDFSLRGIRGYDDRLAVIKQRVDAMISDGKLLELDGMLATPEIVKKRKAKKSKSKDRSRSSVLRPTHAAPGMSAH